MLLNRVIKPSGGFVVNLKPRGWTCSLYLRNGNMIKRLTVFIRLSQRLYLEYERYAVAINVSLIHVMTQS